MNRPRGFTLIELLLVIGIITILAAIILVAIDPAKRYKQARDARRAGEVYSVLNAILNYMADNSGALPAGIDGITGTSQQIGTGTTGCNLGCVAAGVTEPACLDLGATAAGLVDKYIVSMPIDPKGSDGTYSYDAGRTGYYVNKTANNRITVGSCNPEEAATITVQR